MSSSFETQQEFDERRKDAIDKLRSETNRYLRKYSRRIKVVGEERVKAAFALNPDADPEVVAVDALRFASQGMFLTTQPEKVLASADTTQTTE